LNKERRDYMKRNKYVLSIHPLKTGRNRFRKEMIESRRRIR